MLGMAGAEAVGMVVNALGRTVVASVMAFRWARNDMKKLIDKRRIETEWGLPPAALKKTEQPTNLSAFQSKNPAIRGNPSEMPAKEMADDGRYFY